MRHFYSLAAVVCLSWFGAPLALAERWDPFPELAPGAHVAVKESLDGPHFDELRRCLAALDSKVGARFYAAVVEVSAADGSLEESSDAVPYADALYQAWRPSGRLDPEAHVLMVAALINRSIAIHPGTRWADLGFEGSAITRTIDASRFGGLARSGEYGRALCALAADVDAHLAALTGVGASPAATPAESAPAESRRRSDARPGVSWRWPVALGLTVAVILVFLRLRRRRRARQRLEEEIGRWKAKLANAAERLFDLEQKHSIYFAAGSRRWSGQSRSLDQECADAVNHLYLIYSEAVKLLETAESRFAAAGGFGLGTRVYDEIWELLRRSPVRFETGEAEDRRRIFLPLTRQYEGTAMTLLDDLDRIYGEAAGLLEQVAEIESLQREVIDRTQRTSSQALEACNRRGELGLPTAPLLEELERAVARQREGEQLLGDPIKAVDVLDRAQEDFTRLEERARLGNEAIEKLRGPVAQLGQKLRSEVERLREAGFRLEEPGFQPDVELDRTSREAHEIEQLVAAGDEGRAREHLESLDAALAGLAERLRAIEEARDDVLPALSALELEARAVRDRIPEARETLERLYEEHAPEAFRAASDNLEELDPLLAELDRWAGTIREDHRHQRYLAALSALEECEELIRTGRELLEEIDQAETDLAEARERARGLAREDRRLLDEIARLRGEPGAGSDLKRRASERIAEIEELLGHAAEPRPNWLALDAELAAARGDLDSLRALFEEELDAYRRSLDLARELDERLRRLQRQVEEEYRDRPHVGLAVEEAVGQFQAWKSEFEAGELAGPALYSKGESLATLLDRAENAWRAEMELVRQAETELLAARTELRQAERSHYGYGVASDCREARSLLGHAEQDGQEKRWDDVLTKVRQARRGIEQEVARCRRQARLAEEEARRRAEHLRRQRMWEQATKAAVVVGSNMAAGSSGGVPRGSRLPRRGPSFGPSFGSSFANRGGGSGGSSFGGTRSGGSSW